MENNVQIGAVETPKKDTDIIAKNNTTLKEAYDLFTQNGYCVQRTKHNTKHTALRGTLLGRETHNYTKNATGYTMVVNAETISIDVDVGMDSRTGEFKKGAESIKALFKDFGCNEDTEPTPTTRTQSGGLHYFFEMPKKFIGFVPNLGKLREKYPNLDIYSDHQTVHPIAGTTYKNDEEKIKSYSWATDEKFVLNKFNDIELMANILMLKEHHIEGEERDYSDDLTQVVVEQDMPLEEVTSLLDAINPNKVDYDGWLNIGFAMYDRFAGSDEGLKTFCEWSAYNKEKYNEQFTENKWHCGGLVPNRITYKHLRYAAADHRIIKVKKSIDKAKGSEKLQEVIKNIAKSSQWQGTDSKTSLVILEEFSELINNRYKQLKVSNSEIKVLQARAIFKMLEHTTTKDDLSGMEQNAIDEVQIYNRVGKYRIVINGLRSLEMGASEVSKYLKAEGFKKKQIEVLINDIQNISATIITANYSQREEVVIKVGKHPSEVGVNPALFIDLNPIMALSDDNFEIDMSIANDYMTNVWGGKVEEFIKLVALTVKFGAKLKLISLIAPSNCGKTTLCKQLGSVKINQKALLSSLSASRGLSVKDGDSILASGMIVVDEMDSAIPSDFKELTDDNVNLSIFGGKGDGSIKTTLASIIFTAIHTEMINGVSDEFDNRLLAVIVNEEDITYSVTKSPIYQKDPDKYKEHSLAYVRRIFKEYVLSDLRLADLMELQEKYKIKETQSVISLSIKKKLYSHILSQVDAERNFDFISKDDRYFVSVNGKKELLNMAERLASKYGQDEPLEMAKTVHKLVVNTNPDDRKRIKGVMFAPILTEEEVDFAVI